MAVTRKQTAVLVLAAAALGIGAATYVIRQRGRDHPPDSAPARAAKGRHRFGKYAVTGRTVTIHKPREELYAFWRDFKNLPSFMENIRDVTVGEDGQTRWVIAAPGGRSLTVVTEIVEEREGELIAWRATPESDIDTEGRVTFRDAPGGRGCFVEAIIAYRPPAGELGRLVAKLFQREPSIQGRRDLKRFKMLMETGEVATSRIQPDPA